LGEREQEALGTAEDWKRSQSFQGRLFTAARRERDSRTLSENFPISILANHGLIVKRR
jgi:hypothetical protein